MPSAVEPTSENNAETSSSILGPGVIDAKHEPHRRIRIVGKDAVEITKTAGELLQASLAHESRQLLTLKLATVIGRIAEWCSEVGAPLRSAYMKYSTQQVTVFLISDAEQMDMSIDTKMTDLEVELTKSSGLSVETFQIPSRSVDRFVSGDDFQVWERAK